MKTIAGICPKHGIWKGPLCPDCDRQERDMYAKPHHTGDQMYKFTTTAFGKPVVVHSRGQYKRLLKQHGCADATISECLSVKPKNVKAEIKERARKEAKRLAQDIYDQGAMPWVKHQVNASGPDRLKESNS